MKHVVKDDGYCLYCGQHWSKIVGTSCGGKNHD